MNTGLALSFIKDSMDGAFYSYLFNKFIRFEPYSFRCGYKGETWNKKNHLTILAGASAGASIGINDRKGNSFTINTTGTHNPHQSISIDQEFELFMPTDAEMLEVVNYSDDFVTGYLYNEEYVYVQSTVSENNLTGRDISKVILDTLRKTPYKIGVFDDKEYDISFNPGRQILIGYTWLLAGWKMWFGKPFFNLVPKEKILAFPHAIKIEELSNGNVFVHLFEKMEESHTPESMFRQWKWQEWMDFDKQSKEFP